VESVLARVLAPALLVPLSFQVLGLQEQPR
jgi:hypothetical protein